MKRKHDDDCVTRCPVRRGEKCRIGHGCWCSGEHKDNYRTLAILLAESCLQEDRTDPRQVGYCTLNKNHPLHPRGQQHHYGLILESKGLLMMEAPGGRKVGKRTILHEDEKSMVDMVPSGSGTMLRFWKTYMKTRIIVIRKVVDENRRTGADEPVISVHKGQTVEHCHEVMIYGPSKVLYRPKTLFSGARIWIETDARTMCVIRGAKGGKCDDPAAAASGGGSTGR